MKHLKTRVDFFVFVAFWSTDFNFFGSFEALVLEILELFFFNIIFLSCIYWACQNLKSNCTKNIYTTITTIIILRVLITGVKKNFHTIIRGKFFFCELKMFRGKQLTLQKERKYLGVVSPHSTLSITSTFQGISEKCVYWCLFSED